MDVNQLKQYDHVRLTDGRTATIVEIFGNHDAFLVDIDLNNDWKTIDIWPNDILELLTIYPPESKTNL